MIVAAYAHIDVVRLLVGSVGQLVQGGSPYSVMESITPAVERCRDPELTPHLQPLLALVPKDRAYLPSREEVARAIQTASDNLSPLVTEFERALLQSASSRLSHLLGETKGPKTTSGVFQRQARGTEPSGNMDLDRQMREAIFISIGGALHDANNTLTVLQGTVALARRQRPEVLQLVIGNATVAGTLTEVDEQTHAIIQLVRELRLQIESMREVVPETANDLRNLLLSGGYVDRIFSKLAKVRLFLGRVQKRMSSVEASIQDDAKDSCWKLFESIGNCIDFTKLSASLFRGLLDIQHYYEASENPQPVNLHAHLRTSMIQAVLGKGIRLRMNLDSDPWEVNGPSRAIWQVIINLVGNARHVMGDFGALEIETQKIHLTEEESVSLAHHYLSSGPRAGDFMLMKVRDTGSGIPSPNLPRIFELWVSGRQSSGYGLAVTRKIVEDMGGFIGVDSATEGDGRGTAFSIYFPRLT